MFDDLERVRSEPTLLALFAHYAQRGEEARVLWQHRLTHWEGCEGASLSKLYGELIALDWLEPNIGQTPAGYRVTQAGFRAFQLLQSSFNEAATAWMESEPRAA